MESGDGASGCMNGIVDRCRELRARSHLTLVMTTHGTKAKR